MIDKKVFAASIRQVFAPIAGLLEDASVTEVLVNGPDEVLVERQGRLEKTNCRFEDDEELMAGIRLLGQFVGRVVDASHPILEARMPDGSRVEAVLPPASPEGPHLAIRRFSKESLTMERLVAFGALDNPAATLLRALMACKQNIIVAGGTGSGKTSMLNALSAYCGDDERIVVIEDSRELQLQREHVVQFEAQPPDAKGRGQVSIRDLFKATLRLRPDRIVVGEIRGAEALELIQAMTSGHGGCLSTVHATYPRDTLARLETMALMSDVELPIRALRAQVASAVDVIVQTGRLRDGARVVTHVTEVIGLDCEGRYETRDLLTRRLESTEHGALQSQLVASGERPQCWAQAEALGL